MILWSRLFKLPLSCLPLDLFTDQEISTEEARRHEIPKGAFLSRIFLKKFTSASMSYCFSVWMLHQMYQIQRFLDVYFLDVSAQQIKMFNSYLFCLHRSQDSLFYRSSSITLR